MTGPFVTTVAWMATIAVVWVLARRLAPGDDASWHRGLSCSGLGCGGACRPGPGRDCEAADEAEAGEAAEAEAEAAASVRYGPPDETAAAAAHVPAGGAAGGDVTGTPRSDRFDGETR